MGVIDGLDAAREAAAGSPTLVGGKLRGANSLDAVLVTGDDRPKGPRRAVIGAFAAGIAVGGVVATAALMLQPHGPASEPQNTAGQSAAPVRAAPLPTVAGPALEIGLLADAERTLEARGVRVVPVDAREAAALNLVQGPQAFRVANVAAGVTAVAPDDIIVGACGSGAGASGAETLEVCVVRQGKLMSARF